MKNIKIGTRIISSFLGVTLLTAIMGVFMINSINRMDERDTMLYEQGTVPLGLLVKTAEQATMLRVYSREIRLATTPQERAVVLQSMKLSQDTLRMVIGQQIELSMQEGGKILLRDLISSVDRYVAEIGHFVTSLNNGGVNEIPASAKRAMEDVFKAGNDAIAQKIQVTAKLSNENSRIADSTMNTAITLLAVILVLSISLGLYLTFSITRPLKRVVEDIKEIESGNLTAYLNLDRGDELGELGLAQDNLVEKFRSILKDMHTDADTLT